MNYGNDLKMAEAAFAVAGDRLSQATSALSREFGINSATEAEAALRQLEQDVARLEQIATELKNKFEGDYGAKLRQIGK